MKNCKAFCETQTASRLKEIIQPPPNPPPIRSNLTTSTEQKFSEGDIEKYKDICFQSASKKTFSKKKEFQI